MITRTTKPSGRQADSIRYQHAVCGEVEYLITVGDVSYWADGINGNFLVDAKLAKEKGLFRGHGSRNFLQKIHESQVREFSRVQQIVQNGKWEGFMIVLSHEDAIPFFAQVIEDAGFDFDDVHLIIK